MVTDVAGFRVGHWTDAEAGTGCTVIVAPPDAVAAVDVRGGGPATRETELLAPAASVQHATALVFSGGSAFGLDAASGVMRWCEEQGLGYRAGPYIVPIVPAASIFDLGVTGSARRPGAGEGYAACVAAAPGPHAVGSVGAGTGATVGKLRGNAGWCKGGIGAATRRLHDGVTVAALAVVNAWGDVLDERGEPLAGVVVPPAGFVGAANRVLELPPEHPRLAAAQLESTTLACIATDARLTKPEAAQVARMASAGLTRAVSPVNTPFDGDAVFCLAAGARPASVLAVGVAAAEALAAAVRDGVRQASPVRGVPTAAQRRLGAAVRHHRDEAATGEGA
jgi:L-aminopeptidase/D-esterase-like protein